MKKTYQIKKIDCANCAMKIENEVKKMDGIKEVHLDFAREYIAIEGEASQIRIENIQKQVSSVESNVKLYEMDEKVEIDDVKLTKREWIIYGIGILLALLGVLFKEIISTPVFDIIAIIFYALSYLIFGHTVLIKAFNNIKKGKIFDEHLLMTIATIGAFIIGEYIEAIAVMVFYRVGEYLQDLSVSRSRKSIKSLISIKPTIAHMIEEEGIKDIIPEELRVGDLIVVRPGEKVPVDGIITEGSSWLDTSSVTGESMPRDAYEGKEVLSGSINLSGLITIQVTKEYIDSTVKKIMDFVENNAMKKANTEKFMTKFAKYYTPIVVGLAFFISISCPIIYNTH